MEPIIITILIAAAVIIVLALLLTNIRIVPQAKAYVIERLGAYDKTWPVGLHVKTPFIDRVAAVVSLKEDFLDFPPQPVITKDNHNDRYRSVLSNNRPQALYIRNFRS